MTERERLLELLDKAFISFDDNYLIPSIYISYPPSDQITDYLLENGVIVPPCKVGDKVYVLTSKIKQKEIQSLEIGKDGYMALVFGTTIYANIDQIGKTVFLTREEAEKALKEREENA